MLGVDELQKLAGELRDGLKEKLWEIIINLNNKGKLSELLKLIGMENLLPEEADSKPKKEGKIVVVGQSDVKLSALAAIAKNLGISKTRFEFHLEYKDAKSYNFEKLQWNDAYCAVMIGPVPHSCTSKGDFSNVISALEMTEGYPPVIRMGNCGLKITKSGFKTDLEEMLAAGVI